MPDPPPIERAFFREDENGATVFFPWGLTHRGYRLSDPAQRQKASRAASRLFGAVIAIGVWTAHALQPVLQSEANGLAEILRTLAAPGAALLIVVLGYAAWATRFVEGLAESDLAVSREQRLREAAALVAPWKIAMIGVVTGGLSALMFWLEPRAWWLAAAGFALGIGLLYWSLALRRAAADASRHPGPVPGAPGDTATH